MNLFDIVGKSQFLVLVLIFICIFIPFRPLVITRTDDNNYMPHGNALILAGKIPGAWLVQIKDAGHAVMGQYPAEISKILNTFLSTAHQNS
jgi:pimeloyl-ACP methyl ester carboxylesterase